MAFLILIWISKWYIWIQRPQKWFLRAHFQDKKYLILSLRFWRPYLPDLPLFGAFGVCLAHMTITQSISDQYSWKSYQNDQYRDGRILAKPHLYLMIIDGTGDQLLPHNMPRWKQNLTKIGKKSIITQKSYLKLNLRPRNEMLDQKNGINHVLHMCVWQKSAKSWNSLIFGGRDL